MPVLKHKPKQRGRMRLLTSIVVSHFLYEEKLLLLQLQYPLFIITQTQNSAGDFSMGNAAGINNAGGNVLSYVNNYRVKLCHVEQRSGHRIDSIHLLPVLAVLKQHGFEIKPVVCGNDMTYFCEIRPGFMMPYNGSLDHAMRNAIPAHLHEEILPVLRWTFA
jgi:hypothetical protein